MRKRMLLGLGAAALLVLVGVAIAFWLTEPQDGINRQSFARLRPGMTRRDAEAILGDPRDFPPLQSVNYRVLEVRGVTETKGRPNPYCEWAGKRYFIRAYLVPDEDIAGKAERPITGVDFSEWFVPSTPLWQRVRQWLRL
jgi:hypothetical protein